MALFGGFNGSRGWQVNGGLNKGVLKFRWLKWNNANLEDLNKK